MVGGGGARSGYGPSGGYGPGGGDWRMGESLPFTLADGSAEGRATAAVGVPLGAPSHEQMSR